MKKSAFAAASREPFENRSRTPSPDKSAQFSCPVIRRIARTPSPEETPVTEAQEKKIDKKIEDISKKDPERANKIRKILKDTDKGYPFVHKNWNDLEKLVIQDNLFETKKSTDSNDF